MRVLTAWLVFVGLLAPAAAWGEPPTTCAGLAATMVGTDADDDLSGTPGDDVVSLGDGNDRFVAGDGNDVVCGGGGMDDLYGQLGDDVLDGGGDRDSLWDDTMGEPVAGGDGADVLVGGEGNDALQLSAGDGLGGGGADQADGGAGADSVGYLASPVGVEIDVAAGTATGNAVADAEAVDLLVAVEGPYEGSGHPDTLIGAEGDDVLDAGRPGDGRDRVYGHEGDDRLTADTGLVDAGRGNDRYVPSHDSTRNLEIRLGAGYDIAHLAGGRSTLVRGGPEEDTITLAAPEGDLDSDGTRLRILGGPDYDLLNFREYPHAVRLDAADGLATFRGGSLTFGHFEHYFGSTLDDVLKGSPGTDFLYGLAGDDVLRGRAGSDLLRGHGGRDAAYGGPGSDTCEAELVRAC